MRTDNDDVFTHDKLSPEEAYEYVQQLAALTKEAGLYLFGFKKNVAPLVFKPQAPFMFNTFIDASCMGILGGEPGCELYFDTSVPEASVCEDYFTILTNAYYHRLHICDLRLTFSSQAYTIGGCSNTRTSELEKKAYYFLRRKFGDAVEIKGEVADGRGMARNKTSEYERTLRIPF